MWQICKEEKCEVIIGQECEIHSDCNSNPKYLYNKCVDGVCVVDFVQAGNCTSSTDCG